MNIREFKIDESGHVIVVYVDQNGRVAFDLTAHIDERIVQAPPNVHNPMPVVAR